MESSTHRAQEAQRKQEEIRKQIALLQAQLVALPEGDFDDVSVPTSAAGMKRKSIRRETTANAMVLAPPTPSPKNVARTLDFKSHSKPKIMPVSLKPTPAKSSIPETSASTQSRFLSKLGILAKQDLPLGDTIKEEQTKPSRSTSFTDAAPIIQANTEKLKRDDTLAIIDELEPGPYQHDAPTDDPTFERLEPHSGIRLLSRALSHEDIDEYLTGRFYLSPSRLYSCVRLSSDRQTYDVPVAGDWVTIAVVAEMGDVKYTRPPVALEGDGKKEAKQGGKGKEKADTVDEDNASGKASGSKRYINIKLVDFGARSKGGSETGGTSMIRGDAYLSLLLFESDGFDWLEPCENEGKKIKKQKVYRGGSKGAFESMHKIKQGDVVALLNPKILKPFQRNATSTTGFSPATNILAVTPENAGSIVLVGRSKDLGRCNARKKDGQACSAWCDTRISEVCEWHVQRAVESRRAGRAEFSAGTMGMSTTAVKKRRKHESEFDPDRQWGLMPSSTSGGGGATYVLSGHVVSSSQSDIYVGERMGREAQARAQRKVAGKEVEKTLSQLLQRDKEGMRSVLRAREAGGMKEIGKENKNAGESGVEANMRKNQGYSAQVIKGIGFDPSAQALVAQGKKMDNLATANKAQVKKQKGVDLRPRPGERVRSGVVVPKKSIEKVEVDSLVDLDDL
ncbi:hypothetical protein AMATHDRAFT_73817 [Amanita thiersii Skay4041]|uniref:Zinc finger Mcm10/DnaG-type domain-containing protein n=1 Tax=Amanita thiersii Skay4041 TaxID=703135 RepID=A0A2A9NX96_9AGAR|nr:hypothetical protein AMATHDRAFT_73817 [Amanita thiersii Skay4041]